jgi:NADPH:quinone reductase-like Zn-dependent oxidoreductase
VKKIWLKKSGKPEVLSLKEHPDIDQVGDHEILVDVHYSGINFADIMMRLGLYPGAPKKPYVPGYEVSGLVKKIGSAVKNFQVGDSVVGGVLFGGYASQVKIPSDLVFPVPKNLDLSQAAALPVNWITAHTALMDMGRVRSGDRVLIDAASGGVGTLALQILKNVGAKTVGLTSSPSKMDYIRSFGAEAYTHEEFRSNHSNEKFDLILNSQGGRSVYDDYNRLLPAGRLIAYGMSSAVKKGKTDIFGLIKMMATMPRFSLISMFDKNRGVFALNALTLLQNSSFRQSLSAKWKTLEEQKLIPHVDKIFPASEISEAHRFLESKKARGKILISWI